MENNEDIKIVEEFIRYLKIDFEYDSGNEIKAIENLLSRLKTAERMIELMADDIKDADDYINSELIDSEFSDYNVQEIIEYFRNKAKESE